MAGDVMVPIDGSPTSAGVLPTALRVAATFGATVRLVHVCSEADPDRRATLEGGLELLAERARAAGVPTHSDVIDGDDVARALLDHAQQTGAAAIVMLTTSKGLVARATLGSVSDRVMREAGLPVVLVPPVTGDQPAAAAVADRPLQQVLVPTDGSADSLRVAEHLTTLRRPSALVLTLLRAVDPATLTGTVTPASIDGGTSLHAHMRAEHDALDAVARRLAAHGISARAVTVEATNPVEAITAAVEAEGVELIAMSTRGRGGASRLVHGSTAAAVVRRARVPVLLMSTTS